MESLYNVVGLGIAFVTGFFGNVVANDFCEVAPMLAKKIVQIAARALPPPVRDRYLEEWSADLGDVPGTIAKLSWAFGCLKCARQMRRQALTHLALRTTFELEIGSGETIKYDFATFMLFATIIRALVICNRLPHFLRVPLIVAYGLTAIARWRRYGIPNTKILRHVFDDLPFKGTWKVTTFVDGKEVSHSEHSFS